MASSYTIVSNPTSYLPALEALKRVDPRTLADLCNDMGSRIGADANGNVDNTVLMADPNFNALLLSVSGEVESACMVGGRYMPQDLAAICGGSVTVSQAFLYDLMADLLKWKAYKRRLDPDRRRRNGTRTRKRN